jgi:hypothetical protein
MIDLRKVIERTQNLLEAAKHFRDCPSRGTDWPCAGCAMASETLEEIEKELQS